jgi:hypothetical protein
MAIIGEVLAIWKRAVLAGSVSTFREIKARSDIGLSLAWTAAAGVVGRSIGMAVLGFLTLVAGTQSTGPVNSASPLVAMLTGSLPSLTPSGVGVPILLLVSFVVLSGLLADPVTLICLSLGLYLSSVALGGRGRFDQQTYALAAVAAPLSLIAHAVWPIPAIGFVVGIGLVLTGGFLSTHILCAIHGFSSRRALLAVAIPAFLLVAPLACAIGAGSLWWYYT